MPYIKQTLGMDNIAVVYVDDAEHAQEGAPGYNQQIVEASMPGEPSIVLYNTEA